MPFPNYHTARINNPDKYDSLRTHEITAGIYSVLGILNGKSEIQSFRFDKNKFTPEEAKAWLKNHDEKYISFESASESKEKTDTLGRMGGQESGGPGGICICLECGYKLKHDIAEPCYKIDCPECGAKMTRLAEKEESPTRTYLLKLWEEAKKYLPDWLYKKVHLTARGHAGGKVSPKKPDENINQQEVEILAKVNTEKQIVYSVVYMPDTVDSQGDWASAETIEKAAHGWLENYDGQQSLDHKKDTDDIIPIESYVTKQEEFWVDQNGNEQTVPKGTWVIGSKVKSDKIWQAIKDGKYTGASLEGWEVMKDESGNEIIPEPVFYIKADIEYIDSEKEGGE